MPSFNPQNLLQAEIPEEAKQVIRAELERYKRWNLDVAGLGKSIYLVAGVVFFLVVFYELYNKRKERVLNLPPGPFLWPKLGSLPQLLMQGTRQSFRTRMSALAQKYGPLLFLQVGSDQFVLVSSGEVAKEVLIVHDEDFYYRPRCKAGKYLGFNFNNIGFSTGKHHRLLRKLCATQLLSHSRLNTYSDIRAEEIAKMVNTVWRTAQQGDVIDVRTTVTTLNNNILCRMLFGETHLEVGDLSIEFNEGSLKALMDEVRDLAGEYYNDLIPGRKWLDMGRRRAQMEELNIQLVKYFELVITERRAFYRNPERQVSDGRDIVDVLLSLEEEEQLPAEAIKGVLLVSSALNVFRDKHIDTMAVDYDFHGMYLGMSIFVVEFIAVVACLSDFLEICHASDVLKVVGLMQADHDLQDLVVGGTYTSSSTVEWALTELVQHPPMMDKIQNEMGDVVGFNRLVQESDLQHLPYFQAVVKETLRLHPAMPLSPPHMNILPTPIANYEIPAMTSVVIDYAAIGRDPLSWQDPLQFNPARFEHMEMSPQVDSFKLLPFGYGRRGCPGADMGLLVVQFALASLVQGFEWGPTAGQTAHDIDVSESCGVICFKANPLVLSAKPCLSCHLYEHGCH